ncbi:DMT family transporter [Bordetella sp. FB-8]|uniref:DMT family transporter n=1 Tax=Bordetella sp. FB-8 TaxID=1159870 RepID=UPI0003645670|nr:DMT family transporter [Bordetella sp. FB-8]
MNLLELFLLAAIWGASFLFMRVTTPELGAVVLIALRVGIAALVLLPVLRSAQARAQFRSKLWPLFVVSVTNSAIPFTLLAYSTLYVDAGMDSILNATTPLWTALISVTLYQTAMNREQTLGLLFGLVGTIVLVWDTLDSGVKGIPVAIGAALLATLCYGFAVNYSKRNLAGVRPFVAAFGSQFFSAILLLPIALTLWPRHTIAASTWACVAALGLLCTGFAYILYFRLIERVGASYAASVTFVIPLFGVLWGALFLGERVTPTTLAGGLIILFGTALTSGKLNWMMPKRA